MKTNNFIALFVVSFFLLFSSCVKKSSYDSLQEQNDSLKISKVQLEKDVDEYFALMNEISDNLDKIKGTEQMISVNAQKELKGEKKDKIVNDLIYVNDLIQTNRQKIAELEDKLKKSNSNSAQMKSTIARLTKQLDEANKKVLALETTLQEKEGIILNLDHQVGSLTEKVDELSEDFDELQKEKTKNQLTISQQDSVLNTAWYSIGTTKELKNQKILTSGGLFSAKKLLQSGFNKKYFTRIDLRKTTVIELNADKAKILTNHPASSYKLDVNKKGDKNNKNLLLEINNPKEFWSLSKYLVIEIK